MTFFALLTKELRLRMRRERTIWVIVIYILCIGLLGWFFISSFNNDNGINGYSTYGLNDIGVQLYCLLSLVQLFLIFLITPAFTSTAINGEKERQTFDLLLCSKLSAFSLVTGKLAAGLMNALLLIAASIPLFSLVFFFGGVSPAQFLSAQLIFVTTTLMVGTFGLLCSTLFKRPSVSIAIAYMVTLLWMITPLIVFYILFSAKGWLQYQPFIVQPFSLFNQSSFLPFIPTHLFSWNPIAALISTYPSSGNLPPYMLFGRLRAAPWLAYAVLTVTVATAFFLLSIWAVKPNPLGRLRGMGKKSPTQNNATAA